MASKYSVMSTQPTIYLDKQNKPINGFLVTFLILQYDEVLNVRVPALNAAAIDKEISKMIVEREKLGTVL